jgi:hypothetical protein
MVGPLISRDFEKKFETFEKYISHIRLVSHAVKNFKKL